MENVRKKHKKDLAHSLNYSIKGQLLKSTEIETIQILLSLFSNQVAC
jgi:hypothetical protein